ncbi:MAG: hypothetical protein IJL98_04190 [Lachnospiraceae bacterium]|nr:hypothetical protein [Lachnospiraceae bacterium]
MSLVLLGHRTQAEASPGKYLRVTDGRCHNPADGSYCHKATDACCCHNPAEVSLWYLTGSVSGLST